MPEKHVAKNELPPDLPSNPVHPHPDSKPTSKKKAKVVSFGEKPKVTVKHYIKDSVAQAEPKKSGDEQAPSTTHKKPGSEPAALTPSKQSDNEPAAVIPKVLSLGNVALRSVLKRTQVERTAIQVQSDEEKGTERKIIHSSEQHRLIQQAKPKEDEIKLPKNDEAFTYKRMFKVEERHLLIIEKQGDVQTERSELIVETKLVPQRVIRTAEELQEAYDQLELINDLGGLENVFSEDMQRAFRKFMLDWRLSVMIPHTKMKIRYTVIPWDVCSRATAELTRCQICRRRMVPRCCMRVPYTSDFRRQESIRDFRNRMSELTNAPSMSPTDLRFKRLRDELFDPEAPAWVYEHEFGASLPEPMRKLFYLDDDESAFYESKVRAKASHIYNPNRFEERQKEGRLPARRVESYYVNLRRFKDPPATPKKSEPGLKSSSKNKSTTLTTVQAVSRMLKSAFKMTKKDEEEEE